MGTNANGEYVRTGALEGGRLTLPIGGVPYIGTQSAHECEGECGHNGENVERRRTAWSRPGPSLREQRQESHDAQWERLMLSLGDVPARDDSYWTPDVWRGLPNKGAGFKFREGEGYVRTYARNAPTFRNGGTFRMVDKVDAGEPLHVCYSHRGGVVRHTDSGVLACRFPNLRRMMLADGERVLTKVTRSNEGTSADAARKRAARAAAKANVHATSLADKVAMVAALHKARTVEGLTFEERAALND